MGRRMICDADDCADHAAADHYLCDRCWRRLPVWLRVDIARARVTGATHRADRLRLTALDQLRGDIRAYAQIAALLGERDPHFLP